MGLLDNLTPQHRQLLMVGVPVVGIAAIFAVSRKRTPATAETVGMLPPAPSTDVIGVGQLSQFESAITDALLSYKDTLDQLVNAPQNTTPTPQQPGPTYPTGPPDWWTQRPPWMDEEPDDEPAEPATPPAPDYSWIPAALQTGTKPNTVYVPWTSAGPGTKLGNYAAQAQADPYGTLAAAEASGNTQLANVARTAIKAQQGDAAAARLHAQRLTGLSARVTGSYDA